jgi:putative ABC transport system permease protein
MKLSFKNLLRTKLRTPLTIFAGCIGIIGVGLVLSISKGVNIYIGEAQKSALGNYPIYISSRAKEKDLETGEEIKAKVPFPKDNIVNIVSGEYKYDHFNVFDNNFLNHLRNLDKSLYTVINYNTSITMNILSQTSHGYRKVSQGQFYELAENQDFILEQYDVLAGHLPSNEHEVAILIDRYNCLDALTLYYLGIDYENIDKYTFEQLMEKEFKYISNNDMFEKVGDLYTYKSFNSYQQLYEESSHTLKVSGIIRVNPKAKTELYDTGILYSKELTDFVLGDSLNSQIVQEQIMSGLTKDVFTGQPFQEEVSLTSTLSPEYQYERTLVDLGAQVETTRIAIYTSSFEDRLKIESYVKSYNNENSNVNINYNDYMNNITTEFASLVKVFSIVLIIFSSVSLVVSSIMIGIITYVSVIERTKEIGLLRSIGARKKDISRLFNVETIIIGFFSGILGVIGVIVLKNPVNNFVQSMIKKYNVSPHSPGIYIQQNLPLHESCYCSCFLLEQALYVTYLQVFDCAHTLTFRSIVRIIIYTKYMRV